jgi:hypothetical protein
MKSMLRLVALGTLAFACTACSGPGDSGGGKASLDDCRAVLTKLYDLSNINTPDTAALREKQINQCAADNSLSAEDVACVVAATDYVQFGACDVADKMGS